jgi:hypothetical protein
MASRFYSIFFSLPVFLEILGTLKQWPSPSSTASSEIYTANDVWMLAMPKYINLSKYSL